MPRTAAPHPVLVWVSLVGPAWLACVTSALPLYLNNQAELQYQTALLYPFIAAAAAVATLAMPVYYLALRFERLSLLMWTYYASGCVVLALIALQQWEAAAVPKGLVLAAGLVAGAAVLVVVDRRVSLQRSSGTLALVSAALIGVDVLSYVGGVAAPDASSAAAGQAVDSASVTDRPNVYHILFDEYQTDLFELTLDPGVVQQLSGFTFFDDARTVFGRTGMSLPTIFAGRTYDFVSPQIDFQKAAFSGSESMLGRLRRAGYTTEGYLHPVYSFTPELFDRLRFHEAARVHDPAELRSLFNDLWLYANLPGFLSSRLIEPARFANFEGQNVLNPAAPVTSLQTFELLLSREAQRAPSGRYVFAHLILPHFPNVLAADCSYAPEETRTSPLEQARCATSLILRLIDELKALGRFERSLIVVQSDHGARYAVTDGEVHGVEHLGVFSEPWSRARSRAVLVIKPPGRGTGQPFRICHDPASLLDVYPTMAGALDLPIDAVDGVDLLDPDTDLGERQRWYYFFDKKGRDEWTDEMVAFRVQGSELVKQGVRRLMNNPPPD